MSLFWNGTRRRDHGLLLPTSKKPAAKAVIAFDGEWEAVNSLKDDDLLKMTANDVASFSGETAIFLDEVIGQALRDWRINPGSSFLNILSNSNKAQKGQPMFDGLGLQTRVLGGLLGTHANIPWRRSLEAVAEGNGRNKLHSVGGNIAITASENGSIHINKLARSMRVWEMRNAALVRNGKIKLPKKLYRGVREADIRLDFAGVKQEDGENHHVYSARHTAEHYNALTTKTVAETMPSTILSFTSTESVAKFFVDERGYLLEIDPSDADIVTTYLLNTELDEVDYVSKKHEREWIVRIPGDMKLTEDNLHIWNADWLMVNGDYRAIPMVGHSTYATYEMDGQKIRAKFEYNASGNGGKIFFKINDDWYQATHSEAKKQLGFSPIPTAADQVQNLKFWDYDRYSYSGKKKDTLISLNLDGPDPELIHKL